MDSVQMVDFRFLLSEQEYPVYTKGVLWRIIFDLGGVVHLQRYQW